MKLIVGGKDISSLYNRVVWSGEVSQAARKLEFGIVTSGTDRQLPNCSIQNGDEVLFLNDNGKTIFSGNVYDASKSIKSNFIEIMALDLLVKANKSNASFQFEQKTPAEIAQEAFGSIGLSTGQLAAGSPLTRTFDVENIYNIALTAYKIENEKTGTPYIIKMNNGQVEVVEKGKIVAQYVLDAKSTLIDAKYSESGQNAVSKVKMFDTNGKEIGEVTNEVKGGGVEIYRQEKEEDPTARAKGLLKGLERSASVRVLGNEELITGNAVMVKEPFTGLDGKFFIDGDTHTWENNTYICELTLKYENVMQDIDTSVKENSDSTSGNDEHSKTMLNGLRKNGNSSFGSNVAVLRTGESIQGVHYKWGGNDPKTGIDCSGFVQWCYRQNGAKIPGRLTSAGLRSNPRAYGFEEIPFNERKPGDVLWQKGHVALQHENGKIIESGGVSKRIMGYSGVAISAGKGRTFSKAYRYVGVKS